MGRKLQKQPVDDECARQGARVKWLRKFYGDSMVQFSARMNDFNQSSISKIENGNRPIPKNLLFAITAKSGISADFMLNGKTAGLSPEWLRLLLSTPEGLALIEPDGTEPNTGKNTT